MTFEHSEHVLDKATLILEDTVNPAFHISEEMVDKLLDKLSNDNEFRAVFLRSPRIALAYLGHEVGSNASAGGQGVWSCMQCKKLASPEQIQESRDKLRLQLMSEKATLKPILLEL